MTGVGISWAFSDHRGGEMCLPSGASLWQEEMEHSLKVSEGIFGKQLVGGWDRDWSESSL